MIFVDTNYFLRFLLKDVNPQYNTAKELFLTAAKGQIQLVTSTIVFFEIYWVLKSFYGKKKDELCETLGKLLDLSFIGLYERDLLKKSISIYASLNISLEDCYDLAFIKEHGIEKILTFDEKLSKAYKKASL